LKRGRDHSSERNKAIGKIEPIIEPKASQLSSQSHVWVTCPEMNGFIEVHCGDGPIVAVAIHDGHRVRDELVDRLVLDPSERLREEDPHTGLWTAIAPTRIVGLRSRFEVDLNRKRHRCVYQTPKDAWGLSVWKKPLPPAAIAASQNLYDDFYRSMYLILEDIRMQHGTFFVYDLHAYNHRRAGPGFPPAAAADNPQINVCTGGMDLDRCEPVVNCFVDTMRAFNFPGGQLDVRRNVRFRATRFSRWVHENFPGVGISLGIEVKKFFMDEWTGELNPTLHQAIEDALATTVEPIKEILPTLDQSSNRPA
jgi:hypothetical protein